jgi:hypothetical protein
MEHGRRGLCEGLRGGRQEHPSKEHITTQSRVRIELCIMSLHLIVLKLDHCHCLDTDESTVDPPETIQ